MRSDSPHRNFYLENLDISVSRGRGLAQRLVKILLGMETVQSAELEPPYVLTDSIKVILFIKIVIRSSEVSRQYSLNKNYEICILQGREAGNTDCVKTT